ncbi:MAG: UDP-N-acetylmuramate--L-alanine ligase [Ruminococcaceae bacterium]|nr:UDP-N-acetylmuramate--L-alanine ligase [Oscillospiraceae bacterium]
MKYDNILENIKRIHFIGIGGSGMCPLAEILHTEGFELSGSDANESDTLQRIRSYNIPVYMGHKAENIEGAELVVYTAAVKADNPELVAANEKGIPCLERSIMLGVVTRRYNRSIAVAGTHGKTTTTAMISQVLIGSGFDPSAIIGGKLNYIGGNSYVGQSDIIVCEACEYVDTFLQLTPYVSVILNIDADHLDYFKTFDNIKTSFNKFANQTTKALIFNGDDEDCHEALSSVPLEHITFGFNDGNDYQGVNIVSNGMNQSFDLLYKGDFLTKVELIVPGRHNIANALAAAATAHYLGATPKEIAENLSKFTGVHRRFEVLGNPCGITVADDFAHHPTELSAVLSSAMNMGFKKVYAVFQPHTYSRTALLLDDFATALSIPDEAIISEILAVREINTYGIESRDLGVKIEGAKCIDTFEDITEYIKNTAEEGDLVLTLGGGNVYMCANMILKALEEKEHKEN